MDNGTTNLDSPNPPHAPETPPQSATPLLPTESQPDAGVTSSSHVSTQRDFSSPAQPAFAAQSPQEQMSASIPPSVQPAAAAATSSRKKWLIVGAVVGAIVLVAAGVLIYIFTRPLPQSSQSATPTKQETPAVETVAKLSDSSSVGEGIDLSFAPPSGWVLDTAKSKEGLSRYNGPNGSTYTIATVESSYEKICRTHASCSDLLASYVLSAAKKNRGWEGAEIKKQDTATLPTDTKGMKVEVVHAFVTYTKNGKAGSADFFGRHMGPRGTYALLDSPGSASVSNPEAGLSIIKRVSKK